MSNGGDVPVKGVMGYASPKGPKNMGSGPGSMADVYKVGTQGPVNCDNDEGGSAGALNTRVVTNGGQHG
jgi:hypothetical protein